jgi:hypothetical protein
MTPDNAVQLVGELGERANTPCDNPVTHLGDTEPSRCHACIGCKRSERAWVGYADIRADHFGLVLAALERRTKLLALLANEQASEYRGKNNALDEAVAEGREALATVAKAAKEALL